MVRNVIFALVAAVLAAGCAGTRNIDAAYRPAGNGLLVASVTASGYSPPGRLSYLVAHVAQPTRTVAAIPLNDEAYALDWRLGDPAVRDGGGYGRLAVIELAPGDYELLRGFVHVSAQGVQTARQLGYRFSIEPGKATYLGNIHLDIELAPDRRVRSSTTLADQRGRDLPLLHRKYAGVKPEHVIFPAEVEREKLLQRATDDSPTKLEDLKQLLQRK